MPDQSNRLTPPLSPEEKKSVTHGDFWIPEAEREVYRRALEAVNAANVPYVVAGAYAIYEHTGIYRKTKDLDLFFEPGSIIAAAAALRGAGFVTKLEDTHWLAKAVMGDYFVDLIYGMGNGVETIDEDWMRYSRPGVLAATPVRIAPAEELIWHRLFINERHRHDMSDVVHLILCLGESLDWARLVKRTGEHWPLLLAQLLMFHYVYPAHRSNVPEWVLDELLQRAHDERKSEGPVDLDMTRGPLVSRFSFEIDLREWGFFDPRSELIRAARELPAIRAIVAADVWDQRADDRSNEAEPAPA
jgi:hypothetical protein